MDSGKRASPIGVKNIQLKSKMLTRLSRTTAPAQNSGRDGAIASKLRVSPYMPIKINGDFRGLVPVNPGRQRITVDQS